MRVEILSGRDELDLHPVADGDHVLVRCGGQGLRHVRVQVRAAGVDTGFHFVGTIRDAADGSAIASADSGGALAFRAGDGGMCVSPSFPLIVDPPSDAIAGHAAVLSVDLTPPGGGAPVHGERQVVVDTTDMGCQF